MIAAPELTLEQAAVSTLSLIEKIDGFSPILRKCSA